MPTEPRASPPEDSQTAKRQNPLRAPVVSHRDLSKAWRNIEYFLDIYGPIHGLSGPRRIQAMPDLVFVESSVYRIDRLVEADQDHRRVRPHLLDGRIGQLYEAICALGIPGDVAKDECQRLQAYMVLETRLLNARPVPASDLLRALQYRSGDFRILHRLAARHAGTPQEALDPILSAMAPFECLAEIEDDGDSFFDDRREGRFNTLLLFREMYGDDAPSRLDAYLQRQVSRFLRRAERVPEPYRRRLQETWPRYRQSWPPLTLAGIEERLSG